MSIALGFDHVDMGRQELVGGKGLNLGRLTGAGFRVPPGFVVSTEAYHRFVEAVQLGAALAELLSGIDYDDLAGVEQQTAKIRDLIHGSPMPASIATAIREAYDALGVRYVAVRSSGTAEDLADTSFAGQHDTYLDVCGHEALLDGVQRCWASMWSARATGYRRQNGIDHSTVALAVVVQTMVASEVSGVMFTANPLTTATDEIVINASYGLGEAIVSGIVTPDLAVVSHLGCRIKSVTVGSKTIEIVRNVDAYSGVLEREVPHERRTIASLTQAQIVRLARIGARIQEYYEGIPQDIEWALHDDTFYVLQARDITGVQFSWDEELDPQPPEFPEASDDTVWTRAWGDSVWPGAVTPFFYSQRAQWLTRVSRSEEKLWGIRGAEDQRMFKYHKGRIYYNSKIDAANFMQAMPPALRQPDIMAHVPKAMHSEIQNKPWDPLEIVRILARIKLTRPEQSIYRFFQTGHRQIDNDGAAALGASPQELTEYTDEELLRYFEGRQAMLVDYVESMWSGFFLAMPILMSSLVRILEKWYRGTNPLILTDLITGLPKHTSTVLENLALWEVCQLIRASDVLSEQFQERPGREFFDRLGETDTGRTFQAAYQAFLADWGHRGHSDRDFHGDRRAENPAIDYNSLKTMLTADHVDPDETMKHLVASRQAAEADVIASIRHQPLGALKAEAFKLIQDWLVRIWVLRDDERHHGDRFTMSKKRALNEIATRLKARAVLEGDDYYFLSQRDVWALLRGAPMTRLMRAKIAARRHNWERVDKGLDHPMYLRTDGTTYHDIDPATELAPEQDGLMRGFGTSRGLVEGTARIIETQAELHRVRKGDILVTRATDPGWTPVFLVISGLVLETGGLLAHGACISREYGIPAVHIPGAMGRIEDGARISVNGDTGEVVLLESPQLVR
ncbi:MAG TPA: PEP/pyruvate-binding domain-containing protein [Pseudonocardiaceae bacterium]|jgi:pyruvate,water dikinase|nr:PEP/pyruvate-binding domain-containing protein [Pseudonocardiaceae bacterium]